MLWAGAVRRPQPFSCLCLPECVEQETPISQVVSCMGPILGIGGWHGRRSASQGIPGGAIHNPHEETR